jgi:hypothetical protein
MCFICIAGDTKVAILLNNKPSKMRSSSSVYSYMTHSADLALQLPGALESAETHSRALAVSDSLNPKAMFHIFLSYRVNSDFSWVAVLFKNLRLRSAHRDKNGAGIPFAKDAKFPQVFMPRFPGTENFVNVFWDNQVLTDGVEWRGVGTRDGGGFFGGILNSLVYVPILSCKCVGVGSLGQMLNLNSTDFSNIDNVLLELLIAKFLFENQLANRKQNRGSAVSQLLPCSFIFPIIGHGVHEVRELLSSHIHQKTNEEAFRLLSDAGYSPPSLMKQGYPSATEEVHPWSVRSVVSFYFKVIDQKVNVDLSRDQTADSAVCDKILDCVLWSMPLAFSALNPKSMFHVFMSSPQDIETDKKWISNLHSGIQYFALSQDVLGKGVPFAKECRVSDQLKNGFNHDNSLNVSWNQIEPHCRTGDGDRSALSLFGPMSKSLVFVPLLTCNSDFSGSIVQLSKLIVSHIDGPPNNFLLELLLAKFLYEDQKSKAKEKQGSTPLWPCSLIFPILDRSVFQMRERLSYQIHQPTNEQAFHLLTAAGYSPPNLMKQGYPSASEEVHPWSVQSVVSFYFKFQAMLLSFGSKEIVDEEINTCSSKIFNIVHWSVSSCRELKDLMNKTNPLASELQDFLNESFLGHLTPVLNRNGINSIRRLSQLDPESMRLLSTQISNQLQSSELDEFFKLRDVVEKAQDKQESHSLNARLSEFFDKEASWSTALYSTCAVDMLMRKAFYLFVMVVGPLLLSAVGIYLLLSPTVYTRVLPGSVAPTSFSHTSYSTAILCLVGAVGLGPICIGFSYLGSPKQGRYALAYAFYLMLFLVQLAGFVADDANSALCKYLSLDTTQQSVQNCIVVYAVAFAVREVFFFAMFLTVLMRQELYWLGCMLGLCAVLSCNFFIYQYSQSSIFNVAITVGVIFLLLGLIFVSLYSRRQSIITAKSNTKADSEDYTVAWNEYNEYNEKMKNADTLNDVELQEMWSKPQRESRDPLNAPNQLLGCLSFFAYNSTQGTSPLEHAKYRMVVRQHENNFERLFFLAESVNTSFHQLIKSFCLHSDARVSSECLDFLRPDTTYGAGVTVKDGPIKATQRAIEKVRYFSATIALCLNSQVGSDISMLQK